jgi:hypothetical protein
MISGLGVDGRSACHESLIINGVFSEEKMGVRRSNAACVVRDAHGVVDFRCIVLRSSVMSAARPVMVHGVQLTCDVLGTGGQITEQT